jgi:type II secretory pathway pseudopilin PulG
MVRYKFSQYLRYFRKFTHHERDTRYFNKFILPNTPIIDPVLNVEKGSVWCLSDVAKKGEGGSKMYRTIPFIMARSAFTLIELLIYISLLSLFALLAAGFCQGMYSSLRITQKHSDALLNNALAIDYVYKDVLSASSDKNLWDTENGIFKKEELDARGKSVVSWVGWDLTVLTNGQPGVRRSVGMYDAISHQWRNRHVSVFGCALTSLQIIPELYNNSRSIGRVLITYTMSEKKYTRMVMIRNRVVS